MADNTRAKKKRKANDGSPPPATSTPEVVRAGQGPSRQQEVLQISNLETSSRDTDDVNGSDSDVKVDDCDEDEECPPVECAFFSKNIFNTLVDLNTPPPAVAKVVVTPTTTGATTNTVAVQTTSQQCDDCDTMHTGYENGEECFECHECGGESYSVRLAEQPKKE